jgi:hypothetical protein
MYGGVINAPGKITIPELTGGNGALNMYGDSVINAKLWMRNLGSPDPSNSQLVNMYDNAQIIMADGDGAIATEIQQYIDNGWVNGSVSWDGATTVVAAIPEPAMIGLMAIGGGLLAVRRRLAL